MILAFVQPNRRYIIYCTVFPFLSVQCTMQLKFERALCHTAYISSNLFTSRLEILIRIHVLNSPKFCKSNSTFLMYSCLQHFIILHYCCYIPSSIILKGTRIYLELGYYLLWFVPRGSSSNHVNYV